MADINYITVPKGTTVRYTVSKTGYITQTSTLTLNSDQTINIELEAEGREIDVSDYEYTLEDGVVPLTKYVGAGGSVNVPNI